MAYTGLKPADTQTLAQGPADIRNELEGLVTGQVVDAGLLNGIAAGNAAGKIPISNGLLNINLNADKVDGMDASAFAAAGHNHNAATTEISGFMSTTDKSKLDGIATGAQVNQNTFSNVRVGSTTIQADSAADTLELLAGNNIALTPDATNDRVTIAVTGKVANAAIADTAAACTGNAATATTASLCTGNAATATKLATARTITISGKAAGAATAFDGNSNITIPITAITADTCTGNAATASSAAVCTGNAATATRLASSRNISLAGDVTGAASFDGSANIVISATVADDSHKHTADTLDIKNDWWQFVNKVMIGADTASFTVSDLDMASKEYMFQIDTLGCAYASTGGYYLYVYPNTTTQTNTTDYGYVSTSARGAGNYYALMCGTLYNAEYPPGNQSISRRTICAWVTKDNYAQMQLMPTFDYFYGFSNAIYMSANQVAASAWNSVTFYSTNGGSNAALLVGIRSGTVCRIYSRPRN